MWGSKRSPILSCVFALLLVVLLSACEEKRQPLPYLGEVPEFSFIDEEGRTFSSNELKGKVWSANFFFTSCPLICPAIEGKLSKVVQRFQSESNVMFLSISVDPERDTPSALKEYSARFNAPAGKWKFLTGDFAKIAHLGQEVFHLGGFEEPMLHSTRIMLVDQSMKIRGAFSTEDEAGFITLQNSIKNLLTTPR